MKERTWFTLGLTVALLVYGAVLMAIVSVKAEQTAPADAHKVITTPSGEVIQLGSALKTNEGVSTIPNGNAITCYDNNQNGRVAICRMKDRQSGDIVSARDPSEKDLYFGFRQGVAGRKYDWHQNGYRNCWTCTTHWGDKKSVHDGIAGTSVDDPDSAPAVMGSSPPSTATATATAGGVISTKGWRAW